MYYQIKELKQQLSTFQNNYTINDNTYNQVSILINSINSIDQETKSNHKIIQEGLQDFYTSFYDLRDSIQSWKNINSQDKNISMLCKKLEQTADLIAFAGIEEVASSISKLNKNDITTISVLFNNNEELKILPTSTSPNRLAPPPTMH